MTVLCFTLWQKHHLRVLEQMGELHLSLQVQEVHVHVKGSSSRKHSAMYAKSALAERTVL